MAWMRRPDGGNFAGVPRGGKPVVNHRADRAAPHGRFACALVAGNEQQDALAAHDGVVERSVDRPPGAVEAQSVKVDDTVRLDGAAA